MPKRVVATKEPVAKKAKVDVAVAAPETPLLDALAGVEHIPKPCRELLQIALPYCLATSPSERHKFQLEMLDRITTIFDNIEEQRWVALSEEESQMASVQAEKDAAALDLETKQAATSQKKNECDEKSNHVNAAKDELAQAKKATTSAEKQDEEVGANKAKLDAIQESFQGILKESWQPLKDGAFPGTQWSKRNKTITEFMKKMTEQVQMEGSLLDALEVTLKTKPEQRSSFALVALEHAEDCYKDRTESIAREISSVTEERNAHQATIEAATAAQHEKEKLLEDAVKERDAEQCQWVDLENTAAVAKQMLQNMENKVEDAKTIVSSLTDELEKFREIPALLSKLKCPNTAHEETVEMEGVGAVEESAQTSVPDALEPEAPVPMVEAA
jgi:hypothetical protein